MGLVVTVKQPPPMNIYLCDLAEVFTDELIYLSFILNCLTFSWKL